MSANARKPIFSAVFLTLTLTTLALLPAFAFAADIIIDDGDAGYSETPAIFSSASNACGFNGDYRFETSGTTDFAEWVPTLPGAGTYKVYVHYCVHSARPDAVVHRIVADNGTTVVTVDQTKNANGATVADFTASGWKFLGTFAMTPSSGHKVELDTSDTGDTAADAVRFSPDLIVPTDYPTIQAAINASAPGATIFVLPGTYIEDLVFNSTRTDINLVGTSATIKGIANVPVASAPLAVPNIEILADGVSIHGFTIEGPNYEAGKYSSGMVIGAQNVHIYSNNFEVTPAANAGEISQAIQTYHVLAIPGVDISGLEIHDNTFTHLSGGAAGYEGIWVNLDAGVGGIEIDDNEFTGNVFRAITTERSNTVISDNLIRTSLNPDVPGSGAWQGINIGGANSGFISDVLVIGNTIEGSSGFEYGIKLGFNSSSTFSDVIISENNIHDSDTGIWFKFSADGVIVHRNNIFGNVIGLQNDDAVNVADARFNWWGDASGPFHTADNPGGLGDPVSDNVDFSFWLFSLFNPSDTSKPKVSQLLLSDPSPVTAGTEVFTLKFDNDMNISFVPEVKLTKGLTTHIVSTNSTNASWVNGWSDIRTWNGFFVVDGSTGDGEYKVRIAKARDVNDNQMSVDSSRKILIDTGFPQLLEAFAPNIYDGEDLTVSASAYDPDSSGIGKITVKIDGGSEEDMNFAFSQTQRIGGRNVNVSTYFLTIANGDISGPNPHTATFKTFDNANNAGTTSAVSFYEDTNSTSTGGTIAYLCKSDPASETVKKFDFGTKTSQLQTGYKRVTHLTLYPTTSSGSTYGWVSAAFGSVDRGVGTKLTRDLVFDSASREFKVNLPSDTYNVTVLMGDMLFAHDDMSVTIEGNVSGDIDSNVGQIQVRTFIVSITDGQLNIIFSDTGGANLDWVVNGIEISSTPICLDGIEKETINWLKGKGWTVDFEKYNSWNITGLLGHDLIVCSDEEKACKPTDAVMAAHKNNDKPFVEISDSSRAKAADGFDYLTSAGGSRSRATTNVFIERADSITNGFFNSVQVLLSPERLTKIVRTLPANVKDIASADDSPRGTNLFKVEETGSQGRFAYVGWLFGRRTSSGFTGWTAFDLTSDGQTMLERALNWAQCGNPTGCL